MARFWLSEIFAKSEQHPEARVIHVSLMTDSKDPLCLEPAKVHFQRFHRTDIRLGQPGFCSAKRMSPPLRNKL